MTDRVQELFGAEDVKALRLRLGCTQEEFAKIVGVTVAALSRWETGRAAPRGRNGALFAFLRDRMDAGAEPETLKRLLLIIPTMIGIMAISFVIIQLPFGLLRISHPC